MGPSSCVCWFITPSTRRYNYLSVAYTSIHYGYDRVICTNWKPKRTRAPPCNNDTNHWLVVWETTPFFWDPLKPRFIDSDSFILEDYSEVLMLDKTRIYDEIWYYILYILYYIIFYYIISLYIISYYYILFYIKYYIILNFIYYIILYYLILYCIA